MRASQFIDVRMFSVINTTTQHKEKHNMKNLKLSLIAAATAAIIATTATAGPDRVSVLVGSKHFGSSGFNEKNYGVFLTWEDLGPVDVSVGAFKNSYYKTSVAVTAALPVYDWGTGEISLFAGIAHYPEDGRNFKYGMQDIVPIGGIQARQGNMFVQFTPMDGKPVDALIAFGFTMSLN